MKLNLLPTYVKQGQARSKIAIALAVLFFLINGGLFYYYTQQAAELQTLKDENQTLQSKYQAVVAKSAEADSILDQSKLLLTQTAIVEEVRKYNNLYPMVYSVIARYIPDGVRLNSMEIATGEGGDGRGTLRMQANIKDLRQLGQVLSSFYNCEIVEVVGIDEIKGDRVQFPSNPGEAGTGADPNAGGRGGAGGPGGLGAINPNLAGRGGAGLITGPQVEPVLPGYNTYTITCVLKPTFHNVPLKFVKPNVLATLQTAGGQPIAAGSGNPNGGQPQ